MEEKVRLYVNKKEMHEYMVAAVFNCIVAVFVCSFETIIEGVMVEKKEKKVYRNRRRSVDILFGVWTR